MNQISNERLATLERKYLRELPDTLANIEDLWRKLIYTKWNDDVFSLLHRLIHGIAGSAGSYGFTEIGKAASALDELCREIEDSGKPPGAEQRSMISTFLEGIRLQLENTPEDDTVLMPVTDSRLVEVPEQLFESSSEALVFLVEDEEDQRNLLEMKLMDRGHTVESFASIAELNEVLTETLPDVIILDIMLDEGSDAGLEHARELKNGAARDIPVLFMSARADLNARLRAVRAGGEGYFPKPVNIDQIDARINELSGNHKGTGYRILVIDDDRDILKFVSTVLNDAGMSVAELSNPLQAMEKLGGRQFDLLVIDMHMPDVNGLELVKMIRQCGAHADTPIIFMSADTDPGIQDEAMMIGADEFIQKPVKPERLLFAVRNRISRVRRISNRVHYLVEKDPVTNLFNRQYFFAQMEKAMQNAKAGHRQYAVLDIDIDNFVLLRDQVGADSWDSVIAGLAGAIASVLPNDAVLSYVSEHMIGGLFLCENEEQAIDSAEKIRAAIAQLKIDVNGRLVMTTCSIGIVIIDEFTISVAQVMYEAELACENARGEQGSGAFLHRDTDEPVIDRTTSEVDVVFERLIRKALTSSATDEGFYTVYQPIATLSSETDEKYDVMLRMRDGSGKEVLPSRFLVVAEKHGLLGQIDKWVTEHIIKTLAERIAAGKHNTFFVKLTLDSVNDPDFISHLKVNLAQHKVPAKRLVFQLSEKDAAKNLRKVSIFANELKLLGCGFALEHFGTTLNSDQLLSQLAISYVKIDGSYMTDLGHNTENKETVSRIAKHALENDVFAIASFVEDANSLAVLWACGVNYLQGHFLQEPDAELNYDFMMNAEGTEQRMF